MGDHFGVNITVYIIVIMKQCRDGSIIHFFKLRVILNLIYVDGTLKRCKIICKRDAKEAWQHTQTGNISGTDTAPLMEQSRLFVGPLCLDQGNNISFSRTALNSSMYHNSGQKC